MVGGVALIGWSPNSIATNRYYESVSACGDEKIYRQYALTIYDNTEIRILCLAIMTVSTARQYQRSHVPHTYPNRLLLLTECRKSEVLALRW